LGFGLALLAALLCVGDLNSLQQLTRLRWVPLLGAFVSTLIIAGSIAGRWGLITNALAGRPIAPWHRYLHYFLLSRSLGFILPKDVTDLGGRAVILNRFHNASPILAGASVLLDRLFDVLSIALFLPPALLYWAGWASAPISIGLMATAAAGFLALLTVAHRPMISWSTALFNWVAARLRRLPFFGSRSPQPLTAPDLTQRVLLQTYLLTLLKFGGTVLRLVLFSLALETPIPAHFILLGAPIGQFSYLFAFTPGGLGIFEAGWFAVLTVAGMERTAITPFLAEQRVATYLCVATWTLLSHLYHVASRQTVTR
jgi:uncharacterized protein (TIRG00374 family)